MKLLTCTKEGQGKRKNDFYWTDEGEIALFGSQCSRATVDDRCGCRRAMSGITSKKGTTTMKVAEVDITHEGLKQRIRTSYITGGWGAPSEVHLEAEAKELETIGNKWPVGTIIERRQNLQERKL